MSHSPVWREQVRRANLEVLDFIKDSKHFGQIPSGIEYG
jgi:hypothetical protein